MHEASIAADEQLDVEDDLYYAPARDAAIELVKTPAPDNAAMQAKIDVIKSFQLQLDDETRSVFDFVRADALRLAA